MQFGIRGKLLIACGALVLGSAAIGTLGSVNAAALNQRSSDIYIDDPQGTGLIATLIQDTWQNRQDVLIQLLSTDGALRIAAAADSAKLDQQIDTTIQDMRREDLDGGQAAEIDRIARVWIAYVQTRDTVTLSAARRHAMNQAMPALDGADSTQFAPVSAALSALVVSKQDEAAGKNAASQASFQTFNQLIVGATIVTLLAGLGLALWLSAGIASAARRVAVAAQGLAHGDIVQQIAVHSKDELGAMAGSLRAMIAYQQAMAAVATQIAAGNLEVGVQPHSERDVLGTAFATMLGNLRAMVATRTRLEEELVAHNAALQNGLAWRERAVTALRASDERFELVSRATNDVIRDWDLGTDAVWWNEGLQIQFGYLPAAIEPGLESWTTRLHPADADRVGAGVQAALAAGRRLWSDEYRFRHADGSYADILDRAFVLYDAAGRPVRMIGSMLDISARKQAEAALGERTERLAEAQHLAGLGSWQWDVRTNLISWSDELFHMFGSTAQQFGATFAAYLTYVHPDDRERVRQDIERALQEKGTFSHEIRFVRLDGSVWVGQARGAVVLDATGTVVEMRGTAQDVTERRQIETALRASDARYRQMFEGNRSVQLLIDPASGAIVEPNQAAGDFYGYSLAILKQMTLTDLTTTSDAPARARFAQVAAREPAYLTAQQTLASGETRDVDIHTSPVDIGERRLIYAIVHDVSERKQLERLKSEFISTVSHELRTPLTSIRGSLGLIAGGVAGPLAPQAQAMIAIAYSNSERLVRLINDILDIEKIESGKMVFDLQPLALGPLLEQALAANDDYAAQHGAVFALAQPIPAVLVHADADRLMQVLTNLLSNAAKFSPPGGTVVVSAAAQDGRVRVAVRDQGSGISDEFRARIFQKFAQDDSSDTRQKGGTGLGLSITKAIVEGMGGQIGFETALGAGTTFHFDLPVRPPYTAALAPAALPEQPEAPCILICEDDPDIAALLGLMLERDGFQSHVAYSAEEARARLAQHTYATMTLDLILPDADGIAFIHELHAAAGTRDLPIVVVSVKADAGRHELNGSALHVVDWLDKPIDHTRLLAAVRCAVGEDREHRPRILHVEDDPDVAQILAVLLQPVATLVTAPTLAAARCQLAQERFDLIILDVGLPDGSGLDLLPALCAHGSVPVVLFSAQDLTPDTAGRVAAALMKTRTSNDEFLTTIRRLLDRTSLPAAAAQPTLIPLGGA